MTDTTNEPQVKQPRRHCLIVGELSDEEVAAIEAAEYGVEPKSESEKAD